MKNKSQIGRFFLSAKCIKTTLCVQDLTRGRKLGKLLRQRHILSSSSACAGVVLAKSIKLAPDTLVWTIKLGLIIATAGASPCWCSAGLGVRCLGVRGGVRRVSVRMFPQKPWGALFEPALLVLHPRAHPARPHALGNALGDVGECRREHIPGGVGVELYRDDGRKSTRELGVERG